MFCVKRLGLVLLTTALCQPSKEIDLRETDPVVISGLEVNSPVDKIVAFRWNTLSWEQIPVQVDERHIVDWDQVKQVDCRIHHRNQTGLVYSDGNTFTGQDPNPNLDPDDEVVFMKRDLGLRVSSDSFVSPPETLQDSAMEVKVVDQLESSPIGWVYLFLTDGSLKPGAGERRVKYTFKLTKGDNYKEDYVFDNRNNEGGGNPEDTWVETPYYRRHWRENWLSDWLDFGPETENILLLNDFQFEPGNCGRHVKTFSHSRTAFIANKEGPVRAIRSWIGANSGTLTQRDSIMYEGREDTITHLRVHGIPGIMDYTMFKPGVPLIWYDNHNMEGVTIDGVMDSIHTQYSPWQLVVGEEGSYLRDYDAEEDFIPEDLIGYALETWYLDNLIPDNVLESGVAVHPGNWHMCSSKYMGTDIAWGVSGVKTQSKIPGLPNTDPNRFAPWPQPLPNGTCKGGHDSTLNTMKINEHQIYIWPDLSPSLAQLIHENLNNPLTAEVTIMFP